MEYQKNHRKLRKKKHDNIVHEIQKRLTIMNRLLTTASLKLYKKTEKEVKKDKENQENLGNK